MPIFPYKNWLESLAIYRVLRSSMQEAVFAKGKN
jgi:hypothetical protein